MLKHLLIHPKINEVIGRAGHHAQDPDRRRQLSGLVQEGAERRAGLPEPDARRRHLRAGAPGRALGGPDRGGQHDDVRDRRAPTPWTEDPPVWDEYRAVIRDAGLDLKLEPIEKWGFYEAVATPDHVLTIQTADQQRFANMLLSIGVRMD